MLFNSIDFLFFFPIVVLLYFATPYRLRWILLLCASYYFYMCWKAEYVFLIASSTIVSYLAALQMDKQKEKKKKKKYLLISVVYNIGLLFLFKYFNFFNDTVRDILSSFNVFYNAPTFKLLLPVGISFYTFQIIGYSVDVYKGITKAERHLGILAVYVSFFPQLVAGPIERSKSLLPQFYEKHDFDYQRVKDGLLLMLWGFFKKLVIADRLGMLVDYVYADPTAYKGLPLIIASLFFMFQLFCDFSAYSDIAIGAAQVMGYKLTKNFDRPFVSRSVSEFWRRWHISLSTWMRDYLYYPLVFKKKIRGRAGTVPAMMITFLLIGLWHGASWHFVFVGFLQGLAISYEIVAVKFFSRVKKLMSNLFYDRLCLILTFTYTIITFVFFRAKDMHDGFYIIRNFFTGIDFHWVYIGLGRKDFAIALASIVFLEGVHIFQNRWGSVRQFVSKQRFSVRWSFYYAMVFMILMFGIFTKNRFIYFQF